MATVHTKAIQLVLEPIADAIGHMIVMCNDAEETNRGMPDLTGTTDNINAAVLNFVEIGREDIQETKDVVLKAEMATACQQAQTATENLSLAALLLKGDPFSAKGRRDLISALQSVLLGSQNVLIANDDSEVRMVVQAARNTLEALMLADEVKSEDDLLAIQEALSRKLIQTNRRVNRRLEDLLEQRHKDRLLHQTTVIKSQTPLLFSAMKTKVSNFTVASATVNQRLVKQQLEKALNEIIELVEMRHYMPNWADGMGKLVEKYHAVAAALAKIDPTNFNLADAEAAFKAIDEILEDCEKLLKDPKVSDANKARLREKMAEVRRLRSELDDILKRLAADPDNLELQRLAALKKAELEKAVRELRLAQTAAALEGLAQVFADPALSTKPLVKAAKEKDQAGFVKESKAFIDINKEMNQRAKDLAEYVEDPDKAAAIRRAAQHNEEVLLPSVVHAGRVVLENPNDQAAKDHLDKMAKQWEDAKDKLEQDVYGAIDPIAVTRAFKSSLEGNVKDMRDAIQNQDRPAYEKAKKKLDHLAKEAIAFARREAANTSDPAMKKMYTDAADQMQRALPRVMADGDAAFAANDKPSLDKFDQSARDLVAGAELAAKAAYHPTLEAERLERERAAAAARALAEKNEAERRAEAERIARENEFKPTTELGKAAIGLRNEVNKWDAEGNALVKHALNMTELLKLLGEYNDVNNKSEMIKTAKQIAKEAEGAAKEAMLVCAQCTDKRLQNELRVLAEKLPTQAMQLKIIASVKAANPDDKSADEQMLVCAKALMKTMEEMMRAVAAASIRLKADASAETNTLVWKRKLDMYSHQEPVALAKLL